LTRTMSAAGTAGLSITARVVPSAKQVLVSYCQLSKADLGETTSIWEAVPAERWAWNRASATRVLPAPEATEVAKLTETTYFGLLIAWAQEVERYCDKAGLAYEDVAAFYEEIKYLPVTKFFPGIIGGHCVMPNIEILRRFDDSELLRAMEGSNRSKIERESRKKVSNQTVGAAQSKA